MATGGRIPAACDTRTGNFTQDGDTSCWYMARTEGKSSLGEKKRRRKALDVLFLKRMYHKWRGDSTCRRCCHYHQGATGHEAHKHDQDELSPLRFLSLKLCWYLIL